MAPSNEYPLPQTPDPNMPTEHLLPWGEDGHKVNVDLACDCKPFVYARIAKLGDAIPEVLALEVRHNAFTALPVDEDALEVAQGRRSALDDAEGHS